MISQSTPPETFDRIAGEDIGAPAKFPDTGATSPTGRGVLIRHGFPLPPDEGRSPGAARIWRQTLSRQVNQIVPQLRERPEQRPRPEQGARPASGWSGGVALAGGPEDLLSASWIVPALAAPEAGDGDWWSVAWAGADGDPSDLQCGTGHHITVSSGVATTEYFAWYECAPGNWTEITNLTVNPGDTIDASVRYFGIINGAAKATATVTNRTTGQSATVTVTPSASKARPGINMLAGLPESEHIIFNTARAAKTGDEAKPMTMAGGTNTLAGARATADWACTINAAI